MFITIIRWLKGTVTFIITGAFPERFISACRRNGIKLWNIKRQKENMYADAFASDYKRIRHIAKNNAVKIRLKNKRGAFLQSKKYRSRIGIPIGIFAALLLIALFSARIWKIEINGCNNELSDQLKEILIEHGVKVGCAKKNINVKELQSKIMLEDDRISWIAINIVGGTAYIEVSERRQPPEKLYDDSKVSNIVAVCDGQIKYIEIYSGQAMVKAGETVRKGEILVSGIMEDQYGKKQLKYARAKIIARTEQQEKVEIPLKQFVWRKSGQEKVRWFIKIAGNPIAVFGFPVKTATYSVTEKNENILGARLIKRVYTPQQQVEITLTEKQAKEKAMDILDSYSERITDEKIISRTRKAELLNGVLTVTENKIVEKDIAITSEIEWDKQENNN